MYAQVSLYRCHIKKFLRLLRSTLSRMKPQTSCAKKNSLRDFLPKIKNIMFIFGFWCVGVLQKRVIYRARKKFHLEVRDFLPFSKSMDRYTNDKTPKSCRMMTVMFLFPSDVILQHPVILQQPTVFRTGHLQPLILRNRVSSFRITT